VAIGLLVYALVTGTLGARALFSARWRLRSPRLALAAWALLLFSVLTSLVLAGLLVAAPDIRITASLADLLHSCVEAIDQAYQAPADALLHGGGALLTLLVLVQLLVAVTSAVWSTTRARARHMRELRLVARRGPMPGVLVLDHHVPTAYCLGGRRGAVVLTTAALDVLDDDELTAVLEHEAAHRVGRHHLALALARSFAGGGALLPVFRLVASAVAELLEMVADDAAVARVGRGAVSSAVVKITGAHPGRSTGALAAGDTAVLVRLRRLSAPPRPIGRLLSAAVLAGGIWMAVVPVFVAAAPALAAVRWDYCPLA
jgi:Zn-dependent protease with chaperone function